MTWFIFSSIILILTYLGKGSVEGVNTPNVYKKWRYVLILTLSLFVGFAGMAATDNKGYAEAYLGAVTSSSDGWEPGYMLLMAVSRFFHFGAPLFLSIAACIVNYFYVDLVYKSNRPVATMLVFLISFVFAQEANLVRQSIAIAIFLFSIQYLEDKDFKRYFLSVVIASMFHTSAWILLPLIFFCFIDLSKRSKIILYGLYVFWAYSVLVAFKILPFFIDTNLLQLIFLSTSYSNNYEFSLDVDVDKINSFNYLYNISIIPLWLANRDKLSPVRIIIYVLGCTLMNFSNEIDLMFRFAYYFAFLYPFFLLEIFKIGNSNSVLVNKNANILIGIIVIYEVYSLFASYILGQAYSIGKEFYPLSGIFM